jgi:hypothetical protein
MAMHGGGARLRTDKKRQPVTRIAGWVAERPRAYVKPDHESPRLIIVIQVVADDQGDLAWRLLHLTDHADANSTRFYAHRIDDRRCNHRHLGVDRGPGLSDE